MAIDYSNYSLEDLYSALDSIDKEKFSENYAALIEQIEARKSEIKRAIPASTDSPLIASAWARLGSLILDSLLMIPLALLLLFLGSKSLTLAFVAMPVLFALSIAYQIYFHNRFGATLGKMAFKIKVVHQDYSKINLTTALKRSSVEAALQLCLMALTLRTLTSMEGNYSFSGITEFSKSFNIGLYNTVKNLQTVWVFSEYITCLFNKRRRAIHDFIAGTLVVKA